MEKKSCIWCGADAELRDISNLLKTNPNIICPKCLLSVFPVTLQCDSRENSASQGSDGNRRMKRYSIVSRLYLASEKTKRMVTEILLLDISDQGVKIRLNEKLDTGEEVTLGFSSGKTIYRAKGKVRHFSEADEEYLPYQVGIQLEAIHQDRIGS